MTMTQSTTTTTTTTTVPIRIITKNIRYATTTPFPGEEPWPIRKFHLQRELRHLTLQHRRAFICLQEVLHSQLLDVLAMLPGWSYIGVGRDDGLEGGEYAPILYNEDAWMLQREEHFWLSRTPSKPSRGWDAANNRIVTSGWFRHVDSGMELLAMNTHLDDQGARSRHEAARMILHRVGSERAMFLAGDFNSTPSQEAYLEITKDGSPLVDLRDAVDPTDRYGDYDTYTSFRGEEASKRIDFIFLGSGGASDLDGERNGAKWVPESHAVYPNVFDNGVYNSDHRAVVGDVLLSSD